MSFWKKAFEAAKDVATETAKDISASVANKIEKSTAEFRDQPAATYYSPPEDGSLESFVVAKLSKFNDNSNFYCGDALQGEFVQRKIQNALSSYASGASGKVLLLVDKSAFGKADSGLLMTENELFWKMIPLADDSKVFSIKLSDINKVREDGADEDSPYIKINKTELPFYDETNSDLRRFMKALVRLLDAHVIAK